MRILYIITGLRFGGAERLLFLTCKHLKNKYNYHIEIVYFDPYAPLLELFQSISVPAIYYRFNIISLFRLIKYIIKGHFDIVHTHLIHADLLGRIAALISSLFYPIDVISTAHGTDWFRWKKNLFCIFIRTLDRILSIPRNSKIISISESVKKILVEHEKIAPGKISLLYNAVEIPNNPKALINSSSKNGRLDCLFMGRLSAEKNIPCLIRAIKLLEHLKLKLTIVGEGSQKGVS